MSNNNEVSDPGASFIQRLTTTIGSTKFAKWYLLVSILVLLATTLFWSLLGASLQQSNADQLVNTYLFENGATFHGATFPSAHTFLLKWPIFWAIKAIGPSGFTFGFFTVLSCLLTVGFLAWLIYRIERRPLVFGTLCLALASMLLLVPIQPYAGGLLPVNMAMLATRNIEYIVFIAGLLLLIKSPSLKNWRFWLAVILLSVLVASDKLFLTLGLGGAVLALVVYALASGWNLVSVSVRWLIGGLLAAGGAMVILNLLNSHGITHISSQSGLGPYGLAHGWKNLALGLLYGGMGLLTNFGANPAFDATEVRHIAGQFLHRLATTGGPEFILNIILLAFGVYAVIRLVTSSLAHNKDKEVPLDNSSRLALVLIWTSAAAVVAFILSDHYYAVDARYLTISLFAVFLSTAVFVRQKQWRPAGLVFSGVLLTLAMLFGSTFAYNNYDKDKAALADYNQRNSSIAQALASHPVDVLVGNYWRVMPIKLDTGNEQKVMPLSECGQTRQILSSSAWQTDLYKHSFAYILTLDKSLTGYRNCNLDQVISSYGRPNSSVLISGSFNQPKGILLIYDRGAYKKTDFKVKTPSTVLPISIDEIPYTRCDGPSVMNIVAHQDDDLLFMNPDLLHDIKKGYCIRTVYVTAGDAGAGKFYWLSREQGSQAAYDYMDGPHRDIWIKRIAKINEHEYMTISTPKDNPKISLVFMHLPDGGLQGQGFRSDSYESLAKLEYKKIDSMYTQDLQSVYSSRDLVDALAKLMRLYSPSEIRTQSEYIGRQFPDHSDHLSVGWYTKQAYAQYEQQQFDNRVTIPISFYIGYPVHQMSPNVSGSDFTAKETSFLNYAGFDPSVCQTAQQCKHTPTYDAYLQRQYQNPY